MTSSLVRLIGCPGLGTWALHTVAKAVSMLCREMTRRPLAVRRGEGGGWGEEDEVAAAFFPSGAVLAVAAATLKKGVGRDSSLASLASFAVAVYGRWGDDACFVLGALVFFPLRWRVEVPR